MAISEREGEKGAVYRWGTDNGKVLKTPDKLDLGLPLRAIKVCGNPIPEL